MLNTTVWLSGFDHKLLLSHCFEKEQFLVVNFIYLQLPKALLWRFSTLLQCGTSEEHSTLFGDAKPLLPQTLGRSLQAKGRNALGNSSIENYSKSIRSNHWTTDFSSAQVGNEMNKVHGLTGFYLFNCDPAVLKI